MTVIQVDLPDETAKAARAAGLLTPAALERLLKEAMRRQAANSLLELARDVQTAGIEPMTMEEINAEVKAARAERRAGAFDRLLALAPAMSEDEILAEVEVARAAARAEAGVAPLR